MDHSFENGILGGIAGYMLGKFLASSADSWIENRKQKEKDNTQEELRKLKAEFEQYKNWRRG